MDKNIEKMIAVVPSERQLKWQELEFYGFLHYGLNTYLEIEWRDGSCPRVTNTVPASYHISHMHQQPLSINPFHKAYS